MEQKNINGINEEWIRKKLNINHDNLGIYSNFMDIVNNIHYFIFN
jgi:hypothetical protein